MIDQQFMTLRRLEGFQEPGRLAVHLPKLRQIALLLFSVNAKSSAVEAIFQVPHGPIRGPRQVPAGNEIIEVAKFNRAVHVTKSRLIRPPTERRRRARVGSVKFYLVIFRNRERKIVNRGSSDL